MIHGAHVLLYSHDADRDRAFLRDVLGWPSVDAGDGWLIFGLPPGELAVHPTDGDAETAQQRHAGRAMTHAVVYLMCDDLRAEIAALAAKGVATTGVHEAAWGLVTSIVLPSGGELGLYQPRHPTALDLRR